MVVSVSFNNILILPRSLSVRVNVCADCAQFRSVLMQTFIWRNEKSPEKPKTRPKNVLKWYSHWKSCSDARWKRDRKRRSYYSFFPRKTNSFIPFLVWIVSANKQHAQCEHSSNNLSSNQIGLNQKTKLNSGHKTRVKQKNKRIGSENSCVRVC